MFNIQKKEAKCLVLSEMGVIKVQKTAEKISGFKIEIRIVLR